MSAARIDLLTTVDEIDEVLEVERASFTNPWTREMYLAEFAHRDVSRVLVARDEDGRMVGFCSFWRVLDEVHINNLAVLPARRGQGIGAALLSRLMRDADASGAIRLLLEVRRSNAAALRLYGHFGFVVQRVRRGYYTQPEEDALVLTRESVRV